MADSKLEIKVGSISFSGEGEGRWLSEQLDKVIKSLPGLLAIAPETPPVGPTAADEVHKKKVTGSGSGTTLAAHLKATGSTTIQVRKFLATAVWLHDAQGKQRLETKDVSKALNDNNQGRLGNPADALNQNVGKGHCVKDGKMFYVTPEGRATLT